MFFRLAPRACPVCGQAHTTCTSRDYDPETMSVRLLPARDGAAVPTHDEVLAREKSAGKKTVSTKTYQGNKP